MDLKLPLVTKHIKCMPSNVEILVDTTVEASVYFFIFHKIKDRGKITSFIGAV
jgi:hypothetical protein